ncbi:hypothetical protein [Aquirhabdus parva]|uniref:Uncharacterized protein n=1 Tax=Aquirhabdus parva TaxID=2283318 RepID=A0A345PAZ5_9GAMM|nr:hypothetical protein [Aquirhabdus parva]AXI04454.1 hypothetical protein HYN46_01680 [Aquirhabdus parva]
MTKQPSYVDAAVVPLSDLNIVRTEIPDILMEASKQPYKIPNDLSCATLDTDIHALNRVLGSDYDVPKSSEHDWIDQGMDEAGSRAVGALRRTTEGVVPFRSWVRKLTGAERYSKKIASTIAAGITRRAFLKGVRVSMMCPLTIPQIPYRQLNLNQVQLN